MVHLPVLHLHLGILQPQRDVPVLDVQRSLVNGARPESRGGGDEEESWFLSEGLERTLVPQKLHVKFLYVEVRNQVKD